MGVAICRVDTYTDANDDVKCPMMPGDSTEVNVVGWVRVAEHPCCQPQWFMVRRTIVCSTIGSCRYYVVSASVIRSVGPKPSFEMMLIVMKKTGERKDDSSKFFIFRVTRTCGNRAEKAYRGRASGWTTRANYALLSSRTNPPRLNSCSADRVVMGDAAGAPAGLIMVGPG